MKKVTEKQLEKIQTPLEELVNYNPEELTDTEVVYLIQGLKAKTQALTTQLEGLYDIRRKEKDSEIRRLKQLSSSIDFARQIFATAYGSFNLVMNNVEEVLKND